MVVAVIAMAMVQSSVHQIIGVIGVWYPFMATTWPMIMRAARLRGAVHRICRAHGQRVLVNMIAMNMVEMAVYLYRRTSLTRVDSPSWSRHAFGLPGMQAVTSLTRIAPT